MLVDIINYIVIDIINYIVIETDKNSIQLQCYSTVANGTQEQGHPGGLLHSAAVL